MDREHSNIQTIDDIVINVTTNYIAAQSKPTQNKYVFSYTINIVNKNKQTLQLKSRYWLITDADGQATTVAGDGVVGEQPYLTLNNDFTYTSGCILKTPVGTMQGYYLFSNNQGKLFKAPIDPFRLALPNILN